MHKLAVLPMHEAVAEEAAGIPGFAQRLYELSSNNEWGSDYYNHPVVIANPGEAVYPMSIYLDSVNHSKVDSVCGITIQNMVSGTRHLCVVLRKSRLCRCGCRGWCSMHSVWSCLHWSIAALESGQFPERRHDGVPWLETDEARESLAGKPLGIKGAVVQIKADWGEFGKSLGFFNWSHNLRPCPFCSCSKRTMLANIKRWTVVDAPEMLSSPDTYDAECALCEIPVVLTKEDRDAILSCLVYSRKGKFRGRCMARAIPRLGLEEGDQLQPSSNLPDIAQFETLSQFPLTVLFWRQHERASMFHRLPLFDRRLGVTILTICVDYMHTMNLGIFFSVGVCMRVGLWCGPMRGALGAT